MHRRTGLILAGITGTLLLASVFVVPVLLNADRYRRQVIAYLEVGTGKKVEIGRVTVSFFPELTIHVDDLGVKSPPLFPPSYILKVARIDAHIDAWACIIGADELNYQRFVTNLFARLAGGTLKDGKLSFPFHVGGTIDNPVFAKGN